MAKPAIEGQNFGDIAWQPMDRSGMYERLLSKDPETGNVTRVVKIEPGVESFEPIDHDFWEETWVIEGAMIEKASNQVQTAGTYCCRPPGTKHGPFAFPMGAVIFEVRYSAP